MTTMIERLARAMSELDRPKHAFSKEQWWRIRGNDFVAKARVAIEEMREPTEAMDDAAYASDSLENGSSAYGCWTAMIDAALKEES
jgi:hypothetical protein